MTKKRLGKLIYGFIILGTSSCTWEQMGPLVDCSILPVEIELLESNKAECGASNGSFTVNAIGGEPPYSYTSDVGTNEDGVFTNIAAGSYAITATDSKGCSVQLTVPIENLGGVNLDNVVVVDSGCESTNGSIRITASGGEEPYQFSLNGGSRQESSVFSGLDQGTYLVSVRDQLGCDISKTVEISSGISYENSIKGIIEKSCAITGCHNGSISPDLRSFSNIKARASSIKSRTANRSMPRGSSLSQQQIDMIACWVDDGALAN